MATWRYGALEARCGPRDVERTKLGDLEARCRRADVEDRGMVLRRRTAGVLTWSHRGIEL